jgi:hypothetical protein
MRARAHAFGLLAAFVAETSHDICDEGLRTLLVDSLQRVPRVFDPVESRVWKSRAKDLLDLVFFLGPPQLGSDVVAVTESNVGCRGRGGGSEEMWSLMVVACMAH